MRALALFTFFLHSILPVGAVAAQPAHPAVPPPGISRAQCDWLVRLGKAKAPDEAAALLRERTDGPAILKVVSESDDPTDPTLAGNWLVVNPGILVLAEHSEDPVWRAEGLYWVGLVARRNDRLDEALPLYERARALFETAGKAMDVSICWSRIGGVHEQRGETAAALAAARAASEASDRTGDAPYIRQTYLHWAGLLSQPKGWREELAVVQRALAVLTPIGDARCTNWAATLVAVVYLRLGEDKAALPAWEQARQGAERSADPQIIWDAYSSWGDALKGAKRDGEALEVFESARALLAQIGDGSYAARAEERLGEVYQQSGDTEKALTLYRKALPVLESHVLDEGAARQIAGIIDIICERAIVEGRPEVALPDILREIAAAEKSGCSGYLGGSYERMGEALRVTGHITEALVCFRKALAIAERSWPENLVANINQIIGRCYGQMGDHSTQRSYVEKGLRIYLALHDDAGLDDSYRQLAEIEIDRDNPLVALSYLDRDLEVLKRSPDLPNNPLNPSRQWGHDYLRTQTYGELGRYKEGMKLAMKCEAESERTGNLLNGALQVKAEILDRMGETDKAIDAYRRLLAMAQGHPATDPEWVSQRGNPNGAQLVRLLIRKKDLPGAFAVAQAAKGSSVRHFLLAARASDANLPTKDAHQLGTLRMAYEDACKQPLVSNLDRNAVTARDDALIQLTTFEMSLRARYPRWSTSQAGTASLGEIARSFGPSSAIVEMMVDREHISLLVLRNRRGRPVLTAHVVSQPLNTFARWINEAVDALKNPRSDPGITHQLLRRLYGSVIRPVEGDLGGVDTLIVCPDRYLHAIPFSALEDARGRYLIQKVALTIAPSASAWEACRTVSASHKGSGQSKPVLAAVSQFTAKTKVASLAVPKRALRGEQITNLPGVVGESRMVDRAFGGHIVKLLEKDATVEAVERAARTASVLHFATHAFANDSAPMLGSLLFSPSPMNPSGLLYARDVLQIPIRANLAVLSACQTDEGPGTGEGLLGLAWAFMVAGCPSTIGSRWDVDDGAAERWMAAFYRSYTTGRLSAAESQRRACLSLLATKGSRNDYSAPRFWANWTLIGSDR